MAKFLNLLQNPKIALPIILFITILAYSNTLQSKFVIEDRVYIVDWKLTQSLSNIPKMFMGDTAPTGNYGIYRPARALYYALSYHFLGTNPTLYHIQALTIHLIIVGLIYFISGIILKKNILAFIAALLFGLHPVHTEPIDYLTANFDLIGEVFFFASFLFYLKATLKFPKYSLSSILSIVFATIAFFSFEITLTLPLIITFYDFCFRRKLFQKKYMLSLAKFYIPLFGTAFVYLFIRVFLLGMTVRGEYLGGSFYLTMLTMIKALIKYLTLLVIPLDLSINPKISSGIFAWVHPLARMDKILSQSILQTDIWISFLSLTILIIFAARLIKKLPIITFSVFWIFICLLPVLYIIPQGPIMQERYVYISSFGFILGLVFGLDHIFKLNFKPDFQKQVKLLLAVILILIALFYGVRTYLRNKDWQDSLAVWSKLAAQSPQDVIANFQTGNLYLNKEDLDKALVFYNKTLAIEPGLHEPHFQIGQIYLKQEKFDQAATQFQQALIINPKYEEAKQNLNELNKILANPWVKCQLAGSVTFSCPANFEIKKSDKALSLTDPKSDFVIEMSLDKLDLTASISDYLKNQDQKQTYGKLINQGLARILSSNTGYVKVWSDTTSDKLAVTKLEFFLFNERQVLKILVYPKTPTNMVKFDRLVSSIVFGPSD